MLSTLPLGHFYCYIILDILIELGFLFHILWEAKSQYVFMYLVGLIPLAAFGITSGSGILWPVRGGHEQENEETSVSVLLAKGE